jgi:membrane-associated phospholipid phosphatase
VGRDVITANEGQLWRSFWACFWWKLIGAILAISTFFVAYFYVLNNPVFPVRLMPLLALDHWLPVVPWSVWIYFSLWIYISMPMALMHTRRELATYLGGAFVLSIAGLSLFFFFPTAVPAWQIDWTHYPMLTFLKAADASGNACPSMHVGFAVFSGLWMRTQLILFRAPKPWLWALGGWGAAIVLSTMTTKQHVVLDVVGGAVLGVVVFLFYQSLMQRTEARQ